MDRIQFKCRKCNWSASIPEAWGDLKPQLCGNKKCLHSFRKYPDDLVTVMPEKKPAEKAPEKIVAQDKPKQEWKRPVKKEEAVGT